MITSKLVFPVWMLFIVPVSWSAILPGTFLISLVGILITLFIGHKTDPEGEPMPAASRFFAAWADAKLSIWRAWLSLCLSYLLGTAAMLLPSLLAAGRSDGSFLARLSTALVENLYSNPFAILWAVLCLAMSVCITFILGRVWVFNKTFVPNAKRAALWLALLTAPYLYLSTYKLFY